MLGDAQRRTADTRRSGEEGFTLVEIIVALIIMATLMAVFVSVFHGARRDMKNNAMIAAAQQVDTALKEFERMWPVTASMSTPGSFDDELLTRASASGSVWTSNPANRQQALADDAGNLLLREWPRSPYTDSGVRVVVSATSTDCDASNSRPPGTIYVCRPPAPAPGTARAYQYRIIAWGVHKDDKTPKSVYSATHG